MIANAIEHIVKQFDDDLDRDVYCVALRDDAGKVVTPRLQGGELRLFVAFQTVLRERFGIVFDDRGQFTGRIAGKRILTGCLTGESFRRPLDDRNPQITCRRNRRRVRM